MEKKEEKIETKVLESNTGKVQKKELDFNNEDERLKFTVNQIQSKKKKKIIIICSIIIFLLLILFGMTVFALLNLNNNTVLKGISIRNVQMEGLTQEQAIKLLEEKFQYEKTRELTLDVNGQKFNITPEQIETEYNIEKAVSDAYSIGREKNIFQNNFDILKTMLNNKNIDIEVTYNERVLEDIIKDISAKLPDAMSDNSYYIEDDKLVIVKGVDGKVVDIEKAKELIIRRIISGNTEEIVLSTHDEKCPNISIEEIYDEVHSEPQNATYTTNPFTIIPHKNGVDFSVDDAKEILKENKEEYVIKLTFTEPDILTSEIGEEAFPDLLSSYTTKFDETNYSRAKNVKIALQKLNGVVVMPGEVFSYNKTLGKRTEEAGYENAAGYAGGKVVPMLGGGICQVSSTLYDAVLYANLNVVERHNHMFATQYIAAGRDATVVYGSLDFRFENTRKYPIMIKTKWNGGIADIKIFGIKEEIEYEIEIVPTVLNYTSYKVVYENDPSMAAGQEKVTQSGMNGCKTITYKITKLNGQEISKVVLSTDTYDPLNKIVSRGTKSVQTNAKPDTKNDKKTENNTTNTTETNTVNENTTPTNTVNENTTTNTIPANAVNENTTTNTTPVNTVNENTTNTTPTDNTETNKVTENVESENNI